MVKHGGLRNIGSTQTWKHTMILRRKKRLTSVLELDQLVNATAAERARMVGVIPDSIVRALLLYVLNNAKGLSR